MVVGEEVVVGHTRDQLGRGPLGRVPAHGCDSAAAGDRVHESERGTFRVREAGVEIMTVEPPKKIHR
ncbi:MAG: hypothetical protein H0T86_09935 [Gemmatimonadales bacterium]|nr:hypothetical protein [Gemmatimonadales bacterium]